MEDVAVVEIKLLFGQQVELPTTEQLPHMNRNQVFYQKITLAQQIQEFQ